MKPPAGFKSWTFVFVALVIACPEVSLCAEQAPREKYGSGVVRLYRARDYIRQKPAPDYWALAPYYLAQPDDQACSAASVAMLINAFRAEFDLTANDELATPQSVVAAIEDRRWKEKIGPGGQGVTLDELADLVKQLLAIYRIGPGEVRVVRFAAGKEGQSQLRRLLVENEKSANDFILANFLQSVATGDPEGAVGHFAPVGGYDEATDRVLIFDPDRRWYEPYWISAETLLAAMATRDPDTGQSRGLLYATLSAKEVDGPKGGR